MAYGYNYNLYGQQFQSAQQFMQPQTNNIVHVQNEQPLVNMLATPCKLPLGGQRLTKAKYKRP